MNQTKYLNNDIYNHSFTNGTTENPVLNGIHGTQLIGIIVASTALFIAIVIICSLLLYQKYRVKLQKVSLISSNPCYVSGEDTRYLPHHSGSSKSINNCTVSGGHCNLSVSHNLNDDPDEFTSMDNDNFLNSLEHLQFVGYLNQASTSYSNNNNCRSSTLTQPQNYATSATIDHSLSRLSSASTVLSNAPIYPRRQPKIASTSSSNNRHSYNEANSSVQLRVRKPKRGVTTNSVIDVCNTSKSNIQGTPNANHNSMNTVGPATSESTSDSINHKYISIQSESTIISESTGSTANLIGSSRLHLAESEDCMANSNLSINCDSKNKRNNINNNNVNINANNDNGEDNEEGEVDDDEDNIMQDKLNEDVNNNSSNEIDSATIDKMESSTDSRSSVNSTSAMMSGYNDSSSNTTQNTLITIPHRPPMPDLINSNQPPLMSTTLTSRHSKPHVKRAASASYTNPISSTAVSSYSISENPFTPIYQQQPNPIRHQIILDPLTAGVYSPSSTTLINTPIITTSPISSSNTNSTSTTISPHTHPTAFHNHHLHHNTAPTQHHIRHFSHNPRLSPNNSNMMFDFNLSTKT